MRVWRLGLCLFAVVLLPTVGNAQVDHVDTPPPRVTAAAADWQVRGEPVYFAGHLYYPAGPNVFFNGAVMVRTGTFEEVPLYADTTLEPYSVVYVPIGGMTMRPYERRREGELAGTTGSRAPSFPSDRSAEADLTRFEVTAESAGVPSATDVQPQAPVGALVDRPRRSIVIPSSADVLEPDTPWRPTVIESSPAPTSNGGIWIAYDGARWFQRGAAQAFDPGRFVVVGAYRGFPVYRERSGPRDDIYVPSVDGGPLAHYRR